MARTAKTKEAEALSQDEVIQDAQGAQETVEEPKKGNTKKSANAEAAADAVVSALGDEIDPDELIKQITKRYRNIQRATAKERKDIYKEEDVVTSYNDPDMVTEAQEIREDFINLSSSVSANKILEGKICGFRYAGEERHSTLLAEVEYGHQHFSVFIPAYLLYPYDESKYIDPSQMAILENVIIRRFNSRVQFIVKSVQENERVAYANRLAAMEITGRNNYLIDRRDGKPRITPGMIAQGQVMQALSAYIIVEVQGAEIRIPKRELSYTYVGDAREEFYAGQPVLVMIESVGTREIEKGNDKYTIVTAEGSVRKAKTNPYKKADQKYRIGGVYAATVSYVEAAGVFCTLQGGMDCLVAFPTWGDNPVKGDERAVKITEKRFEVDDRTGAEVLRLWGVFLKQ